jgi:hypothetical protein
MSETTVISTTDATNTTNGAPIDATMNPSTVVVAGKAGGEGKHVAGLEDELEKRKKRADRFGVALQVPEDVKKQARAKKFGKPGKSQPPKVTIHRMK